MSEETPLEQPAERTVDVEDFQRRAEDKTRGQLIQEGSPNLTSNQRKFLRGLAQNTPALVALGARGPVRSIVNATEQQLEAHELVKIKIHESAELNAETVALWLRGETGAQIVQILGRTVVLFKQRDKNRRIDLPKK